MQAKVNFECFISQANRVRYAMKNLGFISDCNK